VSSHCPDWPYEKHANYGLAKLRVKAILDELAAGTLDGLASAADTRPIHARIFRGMTPSGFAHYAGHYRGDSLDCLGSRRVWVDGFEGAPPNQVDAAMRHLRAELSRAVMQLDLLHAGSDLSDREKLIRTVEIAGAFFEFFLRIHPYLNGNGHAARFMVWGLMMRYQYEPARFPVHRRPQEPAYTQALRAYRQGSPAPLVEFLLRSIAGSV
jgi:fido (protein-threonine AMPylation protein)